jgi:peroxiredoxin
MQNHTLVRTLSTFLLLTAFLSVPEARASISESAEAAKPLTQGAAVPDVTLRTIEGADFPLKSETAGKLTVLIFYRGGWCPFCNRHLSDIQNAQEELKKLGFSVLAVSPDGAADLKATADKDHLTYTLLSDAGLKAIDAFGLGFYVDEATVAKYKDYGIKLTAKQGGRFVLPVPALYLLGKDGKIAFSHYDPDYQKRISSDELLKAARQLAGR